MEPAGGLSANQPFVLTLELDPRSFGFFDALRRAHFPAGRNLIPAHLTLFHQLPAARAREVKHLLALAASGQAPIDLRNAGPKSIGRGVAFNLVSPALLSLHRRLQAEFAPWLVPQDGGGLHPHVTVQNKVSHLEAEALRKTLSAESWPETVTGTGLHLWRYLNGPWESVKLFRFAR
ncbi:2'-5' RNA ligase [Faunimonas pinastri]|uniref:2'-5' RNA ligase n=1 Tax=Faunimonas pinastri TaxID=1855383 RepID=A0A1H8ZS48_9HYPH|nr:2'-5' RNA ligase family protein [Faunimonas pinastri]SEP66538.1 2'-5' RNA ligase [Faunimonas pinastri]